MPKGTRFVRLEEPNMECCKHVAGLQASHYERQKQVFTMGTTLRIVEENLRNLVQTVNQSYNTRSM